MWRDVKRYTEILNIAIKWKDQSYYTLQCYYFCVSVNTTIPLAISINTTHSKMGGEDITSILVL